MAKKSDILYTIKDSDKIEDLDSEAPTEFNKDFQFDADFADSFVQPLNDDSESSDEDELDSILRKHGGLTETDIIKEAEEQQKTEAADSDSDESNSVSSSSDEEEEQNTISNDKSGFFEEAKHDETLPFSSMNLSRFIMKGIAESGYTKPTPIQSAVIPVGLLGKDIVAGAVTGSGKTAAYLIPTLERLVYRPLKSPATRVVILTPTRELAMQVYEVGTKLGKFIQGLRFGLAVGGLSLRQQEQQLKTKPDIVVATPGRFIDHVHNSPSFNVDQVEVLVLDEADRMLEEGFEAEITEILKLIPAKRQTLLFSATMNNSIQDLVKLSLKKPVRLMINPPKQAASGLKQEFVRVRKQYEESRPAILISLLKKLGLKRRTIVFVAQKKQVHKLRIIAGLMGIRVGELHGSLTQDQRTSSMNKFKSMEVPVLICTDLAARGLDIPKIEAVINYEMPSTYETYLHRIGRTARAGRTGTAISFVGESTSERQVVKSAVQASNVAKQKILGRNIDWDEVKQIDAEIESKKDVVNEVLMEEKTAKELGNAERELERAQNMVKHREEIMSRPKRTWFEDNKPQKRQKQQPTSNTQRKKQDKGDGKTWAYKKTKGDRDQAGKRGGNRALMKSGARKNKN